MGIAKAILSKKEKNVHTHKHSHLRTLVIVKKKIMYCTNSACSSIAYLKVGDSALERPIAKAHGLALGTADLACGWVGVALELVGYRGLGVRVVGGGCGGGVLDQLLELGLVLGRLQGQGAGTSGAQTAGGVGADAGMCEGGGEELCGSDEVHCWLS